MEIIVPAAGLSSRFPNMKPKYLLYDFEHKLMLEKAVAPYLERDCHITIGVLKEHDDRYNATSFINHEMGDRVKVVIIPQVTKGPAETVYQILQLANISNGEFLVKDCDSFFHHDDKPGNYICTSDIASHEVMNRLKAKSFVISNEQGIITSIIEKRVVSNKFCVGGYKFESVEEYKQAFESISSQDREVFVSDVISVMLQNKHIFVENDAIDYVDVGTSKEWFEYNDKPVIFCDIDGTIIKAQSRVGTNSYSAQPEKLTNNIARLLELQKNGSTFIFTTSREKNMFEVTDNMLQELGFKNYTLLIGLNNAKRILINDFDASNPYPRAVAINILRNSDTLEHFL
jgi:hypothetical protein